FARQVVAMFAGQVFFEQQVAVTGIVPTRGASAAGEFQIGAGLEKGGVDSVDRLKLLRVELHTEAPRLRLDVGPGLFKQLALRRGLVEIGDDFLDAARVP